MEAIVDLMLYVVQGTVRRRLLNQTPVTEHKGMRGELTKGVSPCEQRLRQGR